MHKDYSNKASNDQVKLLSNLPQISHENRFETSVKYFVQTSKSSVIIKLERPKDFIFSSGQYIWLVIPKITTGNVGRRAFSIASGVDDDMLELSIRLTKSSFSKAITKLHPGYKLEIIGPMGSAFSAPKSGAILIAGGIGVSPFLSVIRSKLHNNIDLITYNTKNRPVYNESEIRQSASDKGNVVTSYARRPKPSDFKNFTKDHRPVFISGSQAFVDYITPRLSAAKIKPERLHYEETYPSKKSDIKLNKILDDTNKSIKNNKNNSYGELNSIFIQISLQTSNHVVLTDSNGHILFANQAASDITGYSFEEMKGQTPRLWGGLMSPESYKAAWQLLKSGQPVKGAVINRRRDGTLYTAIATITPINSRGAIVAYVSTEEDITAIRELDQAKTEFVSLASHQLRTPLSVINWYSEMMVDEKTGPLNEKQQQYMKEIQVANRRMVELVNELLNVSRLELGTFINDPKPTNIVEMVKQVINEQQVKIDQRRTKVTVKSDSSEVIADIDPKLYNMVIQNLLSNAIKYTPEDGIVNISLESNSKNELLLSIADNGYGIPKSQQSKVFSKLFRADNVKLKNTEGTGLGLYVVKSIVEKSGGKIWFESTEDKGTTFSVVIPIKAELTNKEN